MVAADVRPAPEVPAAEARRFLRPLPAPASRRVAVGGAGGTRRCGSTSRPGAGARAASPGPSGSQPLEPLLRFARALRVYGRRRSRPAAAPCRALWELDPRRRAARADAVSPELEPRLLRRGRRALRPRRRARPTTTPSSLGALLAFEPRDRRRPPWPSGRGAWRAPGPRGAGPARRGRAGSGTTSAEAAYFHRELPYDAEPAGGDAPAAARRPRAGRGGRGPARRRRGATWPQRRAEHAVRRTPDGDRAAPARGAASTAASRGPCKHVLAAELVRRHGPRAVSLADELRAAAAQGPGRVVELIEGATEKDRRAAAAGMGEHAPHGFATPRREPAWLLAWLGTHTAREATTWSFMLEGAPLDLVLRVLRARGRRYLDTLARGWEREQAGSWRLSWKLMRAAVPSRARRAPGPGRVHACAREPSRQRDELARGGCRLRGPRRGRGAAGRGRVAVFRRRRHARAGGRARIRGGQAVRQSLDLRARPPLRRGPARPGAAPRRLARRAAARLPGLDGRLAREAARGARADGRGARRAARHVSGRCSRRRCRRSRRRD